VYGQGWRRENSFVPHNPTGVFCYGFYSFDPTTGGYKHPPGWTARRGPGTGENYRLTASGPGVTPNVATILLGLHAFDRTSQSDVAWQDQQTHLLLSWGDRHCHAGFLRSRHSQSRPSAPVSRERRTARSRPSR